MKGHVSAGERVPMAVSFRSATPPVLQVQPTQGVVGAGKSVPIDLTFRPHLQRAFNFNLKFRIRSRTHPLGLNVKGEGYEVKSIIKLLESKESVHPRLLVPVNSSSSSNNSNDGGRGGSNYRYGGNAVSMNVNTLDFGAVHINDKRTQQISIHNTGKFMFNYVWKLPQQEQPVVLVSSMKGHVSAGERVTIDVSFRSATPTVLQNVVASLSIANSSQKYLFRMEGTAKKPRLEFSFAQLDFGTCFVEEIKSSASSASSSSAFGSNAHNKPNCEEATRTLRIRNLEKSDNVNIDCLFEQSAHLNVQCDLSVIAPGETLDVPIVFTPRAAQRYADVVRFDVNGLYKVDVHVAGRGTFYRLDLVSLADQKCDFGYLRVGQSVTRSVRLVNRSRKTAQFRLRMKEPSSSASSLQSSTQLLLAQYVDVSPPCDTLVSLRARESMDIRLTLRPQARLPQFSQQMMLEYIGLRRPLFCMTGACLGVGMKLSQDKIAFGSIIHGSSLTRKLTLHNTGDVNSKFHWNTRALGRHFSISPESGYVRAHETAHLTVAFTPLALNCNLSLRVPCSIDESESSDVQLTLSGDCIVQPPGDVPELRFEAKVRSSCTQAIKLVNDTGAAWTLHANLKHKFWTGDSSIVVPSNGSAEYKLTYTPLTMTALPGSGDSKSGSSESKHSGSSSSKPKARRAGSGGRTGRAVVRRSKRGSKAAAAAAAARDAAAFAHTPRPPSRVAPRPAFHEGTIFFPLPNGKATAYKLMGTAHTADVVGTLQCSVRAQQSFTRVLSVRNWLNAYQRFKVCIRREGLEADPTVSIGGARTVDVPAMATRDYKLTFFAHKPNTVTRIFCSFLNEISGESLDYIVVFNVGAPVPQRIEPPVMCTTVRQSLQRLVKIENRTAIAATFTAFECDNAEVAVTVPFTVPAHSVGACSVFFRPLMPFKEQPATLRLKSAELGEHVYTLLLKSEPMLSTSRSLVLEASLGTLATRTFTFQSYVLSSTDYVCTTSNAAFSVVPSAKIRVEAATRGVNAGVPVSVSVQFEPSKLGTVEGLLRIRSPTGGEFKCALRGVCKAPAPQGPILLSIGGGSSSSNAASSSVAIKFKNVFTAPETFHYTVDNPAFVLSKKLEKINRKASASLTVAFKPTTATTTTAGIATSAANNSERKQSSSSSNVTSGDGAAAAVQQGKLLITCPNYPLASWVYYLKGNIVAGSSGSKF
jgi:hypothetical protein